MNLAYDCMDPWLCLDKHGYENEYFWISGVFLVCVGCFGVLGNVSNVIVLSQLREKLFYNLLAALAVFDTIFVVSYGICISYQSLTEGPHNENVGNFTYYFIKIGLAGSVYVTVGVSLERCLRLYQSSIGHTQWFYILPISIVVVAYNIPILMERNYHVVNGTLVASKFDWATSKQYEEYQILSSIIVLSVIPLCMVLILIQILPDRVCLRLGAVARLVRGRLGHRVIGVVIRFLDTAHFRGRRAEPLHLRKIVRAELRGLEDEAASACSCRGPGHLHRTGQRVALVHLPGGGLGGGRAAARKPGENEKQTEHECRSSLTQDEPPLQNQTVTPRGV